MEVVKLGTLTNRKIGYGIVQPGASVSNGVPVIKVNNIISGLKNVNELETTTTENDAKYKRTKLIGGELVISVVGTIGKTAIVPISFAGCNLVRATCLIDIKDELLTSWVKYYIDSPKGQHYIHENLNTTVQPTLNVKSLVDMPIPMYSPEYMRDAVSILKSLDDKIEVNRQINDNFVIEKFFEILLIWMLTTPINDNLEQQAQALFKSWFVDFEPFRDGEFVESELGLIPKGWRVCRADEVFEINIGKTPSRKESEWFTESKEDNVWVSIADMGSCGVFISDSSEYLTDEAIKRFNVLMVEKDSVLLSFKLTVGRVAIADTRLTTNEAIARFLLPQSYYREFLYLYLKQYEYGNLGSTSSIATAVNSKTIKGMKLITPSEEVIIEFCKHTKPSFDKIKVLLQESRRLATLRDTLLPKLMSGELNVFDKPNDQS